MVENQSISVWEKDENGNWYLTNFIIDDILTSNKIDELTDKNFDI